MPGRFARLAVFILGWLGICGQAMAQNSDTNQDDPVVIHKCVWLATPVADSSWLILGSAWAGRQNIGATRKKAAECVHAAPETISEPAPCPGGMIGVMSDQHFTYCS
ncbi:MAG TPA: hypothetical protein VNW15_10540 [Rhizomicrobium sp.]|jgi:hypothetical protein|nr:hypothetical protein [Rhizomicrobium sp.]